MLVAIGSQPCGYLTVTWGPGGVTGSVMAGVGSGMGHAANVTPSWASSGAKAKFNGLLEVKGTCT